MKLTDFKIPAIYGGIFVGIVILIEFLIYKFCTSDLGCLALGFIFAFPATILGIASGTFQGMLINLVFYFIIGALIGYLIQKFRQKS